VGNGMKKFRLTILILLIPTWTIAQSTWTIVKYELRSQSTSEKFIKPDQWINKTIIFHGDTISFDFKGILYFENTIDYSDCILFEKIDTIQIENKEREAFLFSYGNDYKACGDKNILLLETKPNCYKYPFREFIICDKKGFFSIDGVLLTMTRD
jgi:hypothetical protein